MLTRRRVIAAKIEDDPGVAETLTVDHAKILAIDPKINPNIDMFPRSPSMRGLGKLGQIAGKRALGFNLGVLLGGSGAATTAPEWEKLVRACRHQVNIYYSINIGAITGGPFVHGESITGGTSEAVGRVMINTADDAEAVLFVPVGSGTFESGEEITGGTSGATADTSSTPTATGRAIEPVSDEDDMVTLTMATYEDGVRKLLKGARGNLKFNLKAGEPAMMNFEFQGVEAGITDVALLGADFGSSLPVPPAFLNASFSIDEYAARLSELELDVGAVLAPSIDVTDDRGIKLFKITDANVVGSYDPEMDIVATHDFYGKWFGNTTMVLDFLLGTAAGNKARFYAPRVQYIGLDDGDREGIATVAANFSVNSHINLPDTEYCILLS